MYTSNLWLLTVVGLCLSFRLSAHIGPAHNARPPVQSTAEQVSFRDDCANAVAQIDQQINNVRARLTTGGDVWWNGSDGHYIVPKPPPGEPGVSSIFAAAVWLGGKDPAGNLKIAAQSYGRYSGNFDFYPGPLNEGDENFVGGIFSDPRRGTIGRDTCALWDQFFVVNGKNIESHLRQWSQALKTGQDELDPSTIPADILGWPARGNPFFQSIHQFSLPDTRQGLAGYWDQNFNGIYEPHLGDYPIVELRGCLGNAPQSGPDEIIFWVYNDAGNEHRESNSEFKLRMEIQVQAFAYETDDDLNNMTFQRYKLINRGIEQVDSTYFAMWVDGDLGCYTDDYIGCDVDRSMAYFYNADALDGISGCECDQGINTYCDEIPIMGIDYFRGPLDELGNELGMSSFTYHNGPGGIILPNGQTDPNTSQEYYNYLSGRWRDGTPFTFGGDGYLEGTETVSYVFSDPPDDPNGWSMCSEELPVGDRRTIQASGPFRLMPGAVNELVIGAIWVPNQAYPCPSITRLQRADDKAQALFDRCFQPEVGPDAPDVDWVELDREIVAIFTNNEIISNNAGENYTEQGVGLPEGEDGLYRFEGYKLYQFAGPNVSLADVEDPEKVRLVYQVDKRNGIEKIFNWSALNPDDDVTPTADLYYVPELKVDGENEGIRHTFSITEDQFAEGDRRLVNHRKYYFTAVAYAYNNYQDFNPSPDASGDRGQQTPYLEGDRNIGDGENGFYTVIPRKILDRNLQSQYGDGARITRIDGVGNGGNFLDISDDTRDELERLIKDDNASGFSGEITYRNGFGPIDVQVFNPLEVRSGEYELTFVDDNMSNDELDAPTLWTLRSLTDAGAPVITAERGIEDVNEQIIREFGFSVAVEQVKEPGFDPFNDEDNGARGYAEEYVNPQGSPWFFGISDDLPINTGNPIVDNSIFDFIATDGSTEADYALDPNRAFTELGNGIMVPYRLLSYEDNDNQAPYLTPAWVSTFNSFVLQQMDLSDLNNVDIVLTSNKDLWSRCVIVETMNPAYNDVGFESEDDRDMFDLRAAQSVSKLAGEDGLPTIDIDAPNGEEFGMGWFPGYAIDVETGERLNIFFGENSVYNGTLEFGPSNGGDMMFNPSSEVFFPTPGIGVSPFNYPVGGQHFIYVTKQPYDRCAAFVEELAGNDAGRVQVLRDITWTGMVLLPPTAQMRSYKDGLIPEDLIVKLRVDNPYQVKEGTGEFNGYPTYRFTLDGAPTALDEAGVSDALQAINVVPNPYYGFSEYEDSQFENIVKITNLPAQATVNIYSLDGKFIRKYERDEIGAAPIGGNRAIDRAQITPALEWDMKNFRGIPIASGVYLIHVAAPGLGERTLKWFGVNRQFDPSGL